MSVYEQGVALLGRSERDHEVIEFLARLGARAPVARPKRGEKQTNIELPEFDIELVFTLAEMLPGGERFAEGELIFNALFISDDHIATGAELPWGITRNLTRSGASERFGPPEWTSPVLDNDRWQFGSAKVLLSFSSDGQIVESMGVSCVL